MLTCSGIFRGHEGLRQSHQVLLESLPDAKVECFNKLIDGDSAFLEWRAKNHSVQVTEGADSFVIRDGKIVFQSIHYKVHPLERAENIDPAVAAEKHRSSDDGLDSAR